MKSLQSEITSLPTAKEWYQTTVTAQSNIQTAVTEGNKVLQCQSRQLMHCNTLKQDNDSTVRGDGGSRVGEVRAGTSSPMAEHKGFKLQ